MREKLQKNSLFIYIIFAYLFSIACRMIWVYQLGGTESFIWNDELMINTNDGYYFATTVKDLLFNTNPDNQLLSEALKTYTGTIYSILWAYKILPFSLDTIILYAPAVISSLIVIPIILIMRLYNLTQVGFFAALIASITWSFYNRTMIGYFDTDMYALVFPVYILYFIMRFVKDDSLVNIIVASILTTTYVVFYPQGYIAISAIFINFVAFGLFFIKKKNNFYISIGLMSLALIKLALLYKIILIILFYALTMKIVFSKKNTYIFLLFLSLIVLYVFYDGIMMILGKVNWYTTTGTSKVGLHFYDVAQTIREAGKIPFETFANRISGSVPTFIVAVIGYLILIYKRKEFLLFLPLVGIGFFAYMGGLRFTVYAVPALAIGSVYFFYFIANRFIKEIKYQYIFMTIATLGLLYPNIDHIIKYKVPTVFSKQEVEVLDRLKKISSPKDYTLAWWDYGYPIWYYSNTNTLIDGGKHHHDNYIISKILTTTSQIKAANLARLSVEKYVDLDLGYSAVADKIFKNYQKDQLDPSKLLEELSKDDFSLPKKTRDIYFYLPHKMLGILPTVDLFSNIDLRTGAKVSNSFFYTTRDIKEDEKFIHLGRRGEIVFDKSSATIIMQNSRIPIKELFITEYDKNRKLKVSKKSLHKNSNLYLIFMKDYKQFIIVDKKFFNSLYIQLFVFENYDKNLFEPVILDPSAKIYKLKR